MRVKLENNRGFTLIEMIIVIAIIAIMSAILIPSISKFNHDKMVDHANYNAQLIFMELQKNVNTYSYKQSNLPLDNAYGKFDSSSNKIIQKINVDGGSIDIVPKISLPDEVLKGTWYAQIDTYTKTVKRVVWVEDYSIPYTDIDDEIINLNNQKNHNSSVTSKKQIVGLYPRGT